MNELEYDVVRHLPVAKFYYQGSHSHPIRRTVLVIRSNKRFIQGYELRCGTTVRSLRTAPVRTYTKDKIATLDKLGARKHREPGPAVTSLSRKPILAALAEGV
jgi:hypothetical protein